MDNLKKDFQESRDSQPVISGSLKFPADFYSNFEIYKATRKWVDADDKVLSATVRNSGQQTAIDFRYDSTELTEEEISKILHKNFRVFFEKALGEDAMNGWDYSSDAIVVK